MTRISRSGPNPRGQEYSSSYSHSAQAIPTPTDTHSSIHNIRTTTNSSPPRATTPSYDSESRSTRSPQVGPGGAPTWNAPAAESEMSRRTPHSSTGVPTQTTRYQDRGTVYPSNRQHDNMVAEPCQSNGRYHQTVPHQGTRRAQCTTHPHNDPSPQTPSRRGEPSYQVEEFLAGVQQRRPMASRPLGPNEDILPGPPSPVQPLVPQTGRGGSGDEDVAFTGGWSGAVDASPSWAMGQLSGFDD